MSETTALVPLSDLACQINDKHAKCVSAAKSAIQYAIETGELLIEAKSQCGHGEWLPWLEQNCEVSPREAQRYMRAARNKDELANTSSVTHLTGAMDLLSDQRAIKIDTIDDAIAFIAGTLAAAGSPPSVDLCSAESYDECASYLEQFRPLSDWCKDDGIENLIKDETDEVQIMRLLEYMRSAESRMSVVVLNMKAAFGRFINELEELSQEPAAT